jgi:hypothetical protein
MRIKHLVESSDWLICHLVDSSTWLPAEPKAAWVFNGMAWLCFSAEISQGKARLPLAN